MTPYKILEIFFISSFPAVIWTSPFWSKIWTIIAYFRGLVLKMQKYGHFVTEPQKVLMVKVTLFLQFEHFNPLE